MDLWNVKDLPPPPINSCQSSTKEIDVKYLLGCLNDAESFYEKQPHLHIESALLSRIIYRMKMKFRSTKDFKAVEKLNRALLNYLNLNIASVLKCLKKSVPRNYKANHTYLPTKNMVDFVLVRLQGLGKLLLRIMETCKIVAEACHQRIRLGHFWEVAALILGAASRIFILTRKLMKNTCDFYGNLLPFSTKLGNTGKQWLPENYILPKQLAEWLEVDWVDLDKTIIEIPDDEPVVSYFDLIEDSDDDVEICDEYIVVNDDPSVLNITDSSDDNVIVKPEEKDDLPQTIHTCTLDSDSNSDVGEVINIDDSIPETLPKRNIKRKNQSIHPPKPKKRKLGIACNKSQPISPKKKKWKKKK